MGQRQRKTSGTRPHPVNVVPLAGYRGAPPPSDLEPPEVELWNSIVAEFVVDTDTALELLAVALQARARMRRCREAIGRDGEVVADRWGCPKAHPLLVVERASRDSYAKCMRLLNVDVSGAR